MAIERELTEEEAAIVQGMTRHSWTEPDDSYRSLDLDRLADIYAPDAISIPASQAALHGRDEIRAWYAGRAPARATRGTRSARSTRSTSSATSPLWSGLPRHPRPEDGVAGLDHGGR